MSEGNGQRPPPPVGKGNAHTPPKARLDARIAFIKALVGAGETTPNILRRVAAATQKEVADRRVGLQKAAAFEREGDAASAAKIEVPPVVWSSNNGSEGTGEPPAQRTIERYVHEAKLLLKQDAAENAKEGDLVMGMQLSRLNFLYVQCISGGKYLAALEVVKEVNRLHGLHGAIRLELSGPHGKPVQHEDVTPIATTEQQALRALRALLAQGAERAGITLPATALLAESGEGATEVESELLDDDTQEEAE
jgi:hypothetical protein